MTWPKGERPVWRGLIRVGGYRAWSRGVAPKSLRRCEVSQDVVTRRGKGDWEGEGVGDGVGGGGEGEGGGAGEGGEGEGEGGGAGEEGEGEGEGEGAGEERG